MWSKWFDRCIGCGLSEVPHHAYGLCINCYINKTQSNNPEVYNEMNKQFKQTPEYKKWLYEYNRTDHHRQMVNESAAKFRANNKELCYNRTQEWREANPDKLKEYEFYNSDTKLLRKYGEEALRLMMEKDRSCQKCGSKSRVAIHHIDWNPKNNIYNNFAVLCGNCHSRVHMWSPLRLRKSIFDEWMVTPLKELDNDGRRRGAVRNLVS